MNFATNIPLFLLLNAHWDPARCGGIEETLRQKNALYHESCRLLFKNTKLSRVEKRSTPALNSNLEVRFHERLKKLKYKDIYFLKPTLESLENQWQCRWTNECAKAIIDNKLLAKLRSGDTILQDLKYNPACLVALYNRERTYLNVQEPEKAKEHWKEACPIALSELVTCITKMNSTCDSRSSILFKFADFTSRGLVLNHLIFILLDLRTIYLFTFPSCKLIAKDEMLYWRFENDLGSILLQTSKYDKATHLAKAAEIIRQWQALSEVNFSSAFHDL